MGQTFVYNTGKAEISDEEVEATFGVFIDGTLNNKANTKLRYKVEGKADPLFEQGETTTATSEEIKNFKDNTDTRNWWLRQADLGGHGDDTSYHNDYTNVSRLWFCTQEKYRAYIEGMGTDDFKKDVDDGYAFGSGHTGIRGKVRKGCEKLAIKISKEINKDTTKILSQVTVDIFGFSRGAASARNMAYEIRKKSYPPKKGSIPDGYYPPSPYSESDMPTPKFRQALVDKDGLEVDEAMLVEGNLPKYGYLGYCLLKNEITPEVLNQITIVVRVLGVYDTVSSYYEAGDSLGTYEQDGTVVDENIAWKGVKKIAKGKNPLGDSNPFSNNEEELNLHNYEDVHELGAITKVVHFTAKDEHRVNFALTRIKGAGIIDRLIEKNFPGVHCDIGGAYSTGFEEKRKIGSKNALGNIVNSLKGITKLELFKRQLIKEHWFNEEQIWISKTLTRVVLASKRLLKKEYSYIPLQFMEEYCRQTSMDNYFNEHTEVKFSIEDNRELLAAKEHLKPYVMNEEGAEEWEFISDEILEENKKKREEQNSLERKMLEFEEELKNPQPVYDNLNPDDYRPKVLEMEPKKEVEVITEGEENNAIELEEVLVVAYSPQKLLRILRNEYLHWSADSSGLGLEGTSDRKREEFPKM